MQDFMKHSYSIAALTLTLLALGACTKTDLSGAAKGDAVATVNGKQISKATFETFATAVARRPASELTDEQRTQVLEQLINMQLAADSAEKTPIAKGSDLEAQLQLARMNVLMESTVKKYVEAHPTTEDEIKAEYDTQVATMGRQYNARHILVESKVVADTLIQQLKAGADFAKLAEKNSSDGSAKQGGDLGWFSLGSMAKPFADAVASLEKGKFTQEPVKTQFGWHIIKLEDFRSPAPPAFDEVKEQVKTFVQRKKVQAFIDGLRKGAQIEKTLPAATPAEVAGAAAATPAPAPADEHAGHDH
jgi:peptidyl-prolyl cis-trans isomerase C